MPKFKRFLRRQSSVHQGQRSVSSDQAGQHPHPANINLNVLDFDLANAKVKEVIVGCWLDTRKLKWGLHNQQDTAIMPLTIEVSHQQGFELHQFQVELAFSTQASGQLDVQDSLDTIYRSEATSGLCTVYLYGRPAPFHVKDDQESAWSFSGHRIAPRGSPATTARWVWSALRPTSSVTDYGDLHCGIIVRHGGPSQPIIITYHIDGQARKNGVESYQLPYIFSSRNQDLQPWLLRPSQAAHEFTDFDIERINEEILKKYKRLCTGGEGNIAASTAVSNNYMPRTTYDREYGPSTISGPATVIQGDLNLGYYQNATN